MTGVSKRNKVIKWTEEAQVTLERARELCSNAQTSLQNIGILLTERIPDLLDYAALMIDTAKEQFGLVSNMVEESKRRLYKDRAVMLERIERDVVPAIEELNAIVTRLRKTEVPGYLIERSELAKQGDNSEYRNLEDFISTRLLTVLFDNVHVYRTNTEKVYQMLHEEFQNNLNDSFQKCSKRHTRMLKTYDELIPLQLDFKWTTTQSSPEHEALTNIIMKENSSLEHELVSILEMLTNHYDQCSHALQLVKREDTSNINFNVLENDASELPEVLKELRAVCDIITNNETRALKFINARLPFLESSISYASEQLDYFREFKTRRFLKFLMLLRESNKLLRLPPPNSQGDEENGTIEMYLETIHQLIYHYNCFLSVFKTKYVDELYYEQYVYPRKVIDRLKKFLNEDLGVMQDKERERRKQWLSTNGDFIPKELKLPGEANLPMIVQIVTEGLESVQDEIEGNDNHMKKDEEDLISFARKMKISVEDR